MKNTYISIPAPAFDLHELVTLYWNESQTKTRITIRCYDYDQQCWLYGVAGSDSRLFIASVLEPRDS